MYIQTYKTKINICKEIIWEKLWLEYYEDDSVYDQFRLKSSSGSERKLFMLLASFCNKLTQ